MADYLLLSNHSRRRMAQRDISQHDIDYVIAHGEWRIKKPWRGGNERTEVVLSRRLLPHEELDEYGHLAGIVLVLDTHGKWLITTYRQRSRESAVRRPYARERTPWRSYLESGFTN
jgi:hypothetical protein